MIRPALRSLVLRVALVSAATCFLEVTPACAYSARLTWTPVADAAGYKLYVRWATQSYTQGTDVGALAPDADGLVRYVADGLSPNVTHYFAVTAYDASHVEGPFSNELSLLVPTVDNFMCYKTRVTPRTPRFEQRVVSLADQFGSGDFNVRKPEALCVPAAKDGGGILDPDTYLESYRIQPAKGAPKQVPRARITLADQFGVLTIDAIKPRRLLVPTAAGLGLGVDPPASSLDHFTCYRARISNGAPKFPKGIQASVVDRFESRLYDVRRPKWLCSPVSKNGEGITGGDTFLMCYVARRAKGQPKHAKQQGLIHTNNQFGPGQLDTKREQVLCVPAVGMP